MHNKFNDTVFRWAAEKRQEIDNKTMSQDSQWLLYLCLLDTLSSWAFPNETDNRKRFIKLITDHSDWEHKDRVSLIQLKYLIERVKIQGHSDHENLSKEVFERISKWEDGKIHRSADVDPLLNEFNSYRNGPIVHLIQAACYPSLLWAMRNWSVHSFRQHGFNISDDQTSPYYLGGHNIDGINKKYWDLVIPPLSISSLVDNCITKLQNHFKEHSIDPNKQFPLLDECWLSERDIKALRNKMGLRENSGNSGDIIHNS